MDDRTGAEPLCTICNLPVPDDAQRGSVLAPGSAADLEGAQVLHHHRSCERDGRRFLAESTPDAEPVGIASATTAQGTMRVAPAKPLSGSVRAGATITP
jgi:hypothetical protein